MGGFEIRDIVYLLTFVFAAGIHYQRLGAMEKSFSEFKTEIRMTLFGADGRNGVVGDVRSAKDHTDQCKQNSWHLPSFLHGGEKHHD